jgi:hypothetical protein
MTLHRAAVRPPLDMSDLDDHPELAALAIVRDALPVASTALLAAHPHLVGDDFETAADDAANLILHAADTLRAALDAYRRLVTHTDDDRAF